MAIDKFIEKVCVQTAVYWGNPHNDGYGQQTYDTPVEISCRWDGVNELTMDGKGEMIRSNAKVLVTQDLDERSYLYLGSLTDFDSTVDTSAPETVEGAYEIKKFIKTPMIKSTTVFVKTAYL